MPGKEEVEILSNAISGGVNHVTQSVNSVISTQAVVTNIDFYFLLILGVTVSLFFSLPWLVHHWYREWLWIPRATIMKIVLIATDIAMAISFINYTWNSRFPLGDENKNWFISIEALWVAIMFMKGMWSLIFWQHIKNTVAVVFAAFIMTVQMICTLTLAILYSIRVTQTDTNALIAPAFFTFAAWLVYLFLTVFCWVLAYYAIRGYSYYVGGINAVEAKMVYKNDTRAQVTTMNGQGGGFANNINNRPSGRQGFSNNNNNRGGQRM